MSIASEKSPLAIVDGVYRLPLTGISIIVAGGGIGGLMFALEAWRQGHDVRVFEKNQRFDTLGDSFGIIAPAWATLRYFPTMKAQFERESYDAELSLWHYKGHKIVHVGDGPWNAQGAVHAAKDVHVPWIQTRAAIAHMLTSQCERLGIEIEYGSTAVSYDETDEKAVMTMENSGVVTRVEADIVVAADGVGTKSHTHISGSPVKAMSSGYSIFRGLIPMDVIKRELDLRIIEKFFSSPRPEFRVYVCPPDTHANAIFTKDFFGYAFTYKDYNYSDKDAKESWSATVSYETVRDKFSKLDPDLLEMLRLIPDNSAVDWSLRWRDPQPKWTSDGGQVIQLGDSAHTFLPTSGNGATQACEDALSLATCLRIAGKGKENTATKVHSKLRFERVSTIQKFGFIFRSALHNVDLDLAEKQPELMRGTMNMPEWIWGHDPVQYAIENYEQAERYILEGAPFQNTNLPPGHTYEPWTIAGEMEKENRAKQGAAKTE
ncbi:FAD/NAD(P)-binding domain-containing protein [Xylariaceae sp. FL1651]|nr:FAD/NAD(P)-binding domain-containing protein [Xylariaceae sp. FL1651]